MKKFIVISVLLISVCVNAQLKISGTVVNDTIPLEFASVIIKNTKRGVSANEKGTFKIEVKKGDTLSISCLGYKTKTVVVKDNKPLKINLEVDTVLDEVVVVAYARYCRITITGCRCVRRIHEKEVVNEAESIKKTENIKIFPNPSNDGMFNLKLNDTYNTIEIMVANMSGQVVFRKSLNNNMLRINLSHLPSGIYLINTIADGKKLKTLKGIVK